MSVVFFTDRDLGNQFPNTLKAAGLTVLSHSGVFAADTPDTQWLAAVSNQGWVAITHDKRIRYKPNELAAVIEHKAALLVIVGNAPLAELAENFVAMKDKVLDFVASQDRPFIAKVYRPAPAELAKNSKALGRIQRWYP